MSLSAVDAPFHGSLTNMLDNGQFKQSTSSVTGSLQHSTVSTVSEQHVPTQERQGVLKTPQPGAFTPLMERYVSSYNDTKPTHHLMDNHLMDNHLMDNHLMDNHLMDNHGVDLPVSLKPTQVGT